MFDEKELEDLDLKKIDENNDPQGFNPAAVYKEGSIPILVRFNPISTNCKDS